MGECINKNNMRVVNNICEVTRPGMKRQNDSIIDYVIQNNDSKVEIIECETDKQNRYTPYTLNKDGTKTFSDHKTIITKFKIKLSKNKQEKRQIRKDTKLNTSQINE